MHSLNSKRIICSQGLELYFTKKWVAMATSIALMAIIIGWFFLTPFLHKTQTIGMAVEFNDHAACAWIAEEEGWYRQEDMELDVMESYVTGLTLSAAKPIQIK